MIKFEILTPNKIRSTYGFEFIAPTAWVDDKIRLVIDRIEEALIECFKRTHLKNLQPRFRINAIDMICIDFLNTSDTSSKQTQDDILFCAISISEQFKDNLEK